MIAQFRRQDQSGNIVWVGATPFHSTDYGEYLGGGLYLYQGMVTWFNASGEFYPLTSENSDCLLPDNKVSSLALGPDGALWVRTATGLTRLLNQAPGNYSERVVRGEFLVPFKAAVTEAKVMSVMPSYNEVDGLPSHVNRKLLQKILREEWGFDGLVVSDYSGVSQLIDANHVVRDKAEAAKRSLEAGVDIDLPTGDNFTALTGLVKSGKVSEAALDRAVSNVLRAKFLLGLFERPFVDPDYAAKITNSPEHRALALKAAQKTITLLKNDGNLLPLDRTKLKRLAVIGPNAADVHLGGYSWEPRVGVSILDGIRAKAGKSIEIRYAEGCRITDTVASWNDD